MKKPILALALVCSAATNAADTSKKTIWSCGKSSTSPRVLHLVQWGADSYVKVFDDRIKAHYYRDGLDKRWDWGLDGDTYKYALVLTAELTAKYYDFSLSEDGRSTYNRKYYCRKAT